MSVIVREANSKKRIIYSKGADSCIFANSLPAKNEDYLKGSIDRYAKQGYRTLLFAYRYIEDSEYN